MVEGMYELTSFILWIIIEIILVILLIYCIVFYKTAKNVYMIGLACLCTSWFIGRLFYFFIQNVFAVPLSTPPIFDFAALLDLNIIFWILIGVMYLLGALSIFKEKITGKIFFGFWIILLCVLIPIFYIAVFQIELNVGRLPSIPAFEGTDLWSEEIFLIGSWGGFLILFYCVEKNYKQKTKFIFSFLTFFCLIFTIFETAIGTYTVPALLILFMGSMAGMALIFFNMAKICVGDIRRASIYVILGHLLLAFSFAFNIPGGLFVFAFIPESDMLVLSPILQILGLILYFEGFYPIYIKRK